MSENENEREPKGSTAGSSWPGVVGGASAAVAWSAPLPLLPGLTIDMHRRLSSGSSGSSDMHDMSSISGFGVERYDDERRWTPRPRRRSTSSSPTPSPLITEGVLAPPTRVPHGGRRAVRAHLQERAVAGDARPVFPEYLHPTASFPARPSAPSRASRRIAVFRTSRDVRPLARPGTCSTTRTARRLRTQPRIHGRESTYCSRPATRLAHVPPPLRPPASAAGCLACSSWEPANRSDAFDYDHDYIRTTCLAASTIKRQKGFRPRRRTSPPRDRARFSS